MNDEQTHTAALEAAGAYANSQEIPALCSQELVRAKLINAFLAGRCSGIETANQIWNERLASAQKEAGAQ